MQVYELHVDVFVTDVYVNNYVINILWFLPALNEWIIIALFNAQLGKHKLLEKLTRLEGHVCFRQPKPATNPSTRHPRAPHPVQSAARLPNMANTPEVSSKVKRSKDTFAWKKSTHNSTCKPQNTLLAKYINHLLFSTYSISVDFDIEEEERLFNRKYTVWEDLQ